MSTDTARTPRSRRRASLSPGRAPSRGFTLIEMLVAFGLLFVALLGMMSLEVVAMRANSQSRNVTEAVALAQDKLEAMRRSPIASLSGASETSLGPQGMPIAGGPYTRVTTVTPGATTRIKVAVSWLDRAGKTHTVNVNTARGP